MASLSSNFTNASSQYVYTATATASNSALSPGSQVIPLFLCPSEAWQQKTTVYSNSTFGLTSYGAVQGIQDDYYGDITIPFAGAIYPNSVTTVGMVSDGMSNTIFYAERTYTDPNPSAQAAMRAAGMGGWAWANYNSMEDYMLAANVPINYSGCNPAGYCDDRLPAMGSLHGGGCNVVFGDGSVHFLTLTSNSQLPILQALVTRAGGEVVPAY